MALVIYLIVSYNWIYKTGMNQTGSCKLYEKYV